MGQSRVKKMLRQRKSWVGFESGSDTKFTVESYPDPTQIVSDPQNRFQRHKFKSLPKNGIINSEIHIITT